MKNKYKIFKDLINNRFEGVGLHAINLYLTMQLINSEVEAFTLDAVFESFLMSLFSSESDRIDWRVKYYI